MKVSKIVMNGFGKFNDVSFDLRGPLTLFYGYNEAGKSTIMGFIRSILFGFPTRKHMKDRYEPLRGGLHGGMVILSDHKGNSYRIERYDGVVSVTLDDGTKAGEDYLHGLLGEVTPDLFQNLFAFSLDELQEISTLQSDEISGYLFNAGTGAGAGTILDAEKKITQEMEQLYKPRGKNQDIQRLLKELEETRLELQIMKESLGKFNQKGEEIKGIENQVKEQEEGLLREKSQLSWIEKCMKTHERWMKLMELQRELDALPAFTDFPEDALNRFEKLAADQDRLLLDISNKQSKIEDLKQKQDRFVIDHEQLTLKTEIENKVERLSSYQDAKISVTEIQIELQNTEDELSRTLRQIDKDWVERDLSDFSTSISDRERVIWFRDLLTNLLKEEEQNSQELHRVNQQVQIEKQRLQELETSLHQIELFGEKQFPWLVKLDWQAILQLLSNLQQEHAKWKQLKIELNHLHMRHTDLVQTSETTSRTQTQSTRATSKLKRKYIGITLSLNVVIPAYFLWEGQWSAAIISFVMAAAFNGLLYFNTRESKREQSSGSQHHRIVAVDADLATNQQELADQEQTIQHLFSKLIVPSEAAAAVEAIHFNAYNQIHLPLDLSETTMSELEIISEAFKMKEMERRQAVERMNQQNKDFKALLEQQEHANVNQNKTSQAYKAANEDWNEWLQSHHLRLGLSAETVIEIFRIAEQGLQLLSRKEKYITKLKSLQAYIYGFDQETRELLHLNQEADTVVSLRQAKQEADKQKIRLEEKNSVEKQIKEQVEEHQKTENSLEYTKGKILQLWQEAGSKDEKQFRLFVRQYNRKLQLKEEKRHIDVFLDTWVGQEHRHDLDKQLTEMDLDQLQQESLLLNRKITGFTDQLNAFREQRGKLQNEIEQLKSGQQYTEKLQRFEELTASFQHLTGQWAARAYCLQLFKKAKEVYEREKQPGVLRKASEFFASITDQQFQRVMAPIGEKRILVERSSGEVVDTAFLSRGTAEQLYLAMRFALADEYASAKISLPVIMDDIFVNFDQVRLQKTLELLQKVSKRQQMIMFTCHPHVRDAVMKTIPEVQQIEIQG
jgi:uncharacterized protein YhaN